MIFTLAVRFAFFGTTIVDSNIYINIRFCNSKERSWQSVCETLSADKPERSAEGSEIGEVKARSKHKAFDHPKRTFAWHSLEGDVHERIEKTKGYLAKW